MMPNFLQVGQGYRSSALPGEVMNYVYSYHARNLQRNSNVQTPGLIDLVRVPRDKVRDRSAYQFFTGRNGAGAPIWSKRLADRRPVKELPVV